MPVHELSSWRCGALRLACAWDPPEGIQRALAHPYGHDKRDAVHAPSQAGRRAIGAEEMQGSALGDATRIRAVVRAFRSCTPARRPQYQCLAESPRPAAHVAVTRLAAS
ncbi:hypothetical protein C8J57DRAFT_1251412 [Mycena rebaudengoi]|jgi:hypothetical protein|nr:hypothetical protein C8J57DRAFT_1251412 [Mycena rebaudengoi]